MNFIIWLIVGGAVSQSKESKERIVEAIGPSQENEAAGTID